MTAVVLGDAVLRRQLARLAQESERTVRSALGRLSFLVRDEINREIGAAFSWSGPSTRRFFSTAYRASYSTRSGVFSATLYPLPKARALLARHVERYRVTASDRADLLVGGKLAIPVSVARGGSGRVARRDLPAALLERDARGRNRGFISRSGRVLMRRTYGDQAAPAYTLVDSTVNPMRLDVQAAAARAVRSQAGAAMADAIQRARLRAGVR